MRRRPGALLALLGGALFACATWAQTAPAAIAWTDADIRASRTLTVGAAAVPHQRAEEARAVLAVVEADPSQLTVVDAARMEVLGRIALPRPPHGLPRLSPDGGHAYLGTRDGWILCIDLRTLRVAAEVRVGLALASFALSSDGKWLLAGNEAPTTLALLDAELNLVKTFAAATADGKRASRVGTITAAAPRTSFVVALRDIPEFWEISYNPRAEDIYAGLVHDFRMGEGVPVRGFHNVRRSMLVEPLSNLFFDAEYTHVVGTAEASPATAQVVNLDVRRRIASVALAGRPVLSSAIGFVSGGALLLAVPNVELGAVDVIDMRSWKLARTLAVPGPSSWLGGQADAPRFWVGGAGAPAVTAIEKHTLAPGATLRLPGPPIAPLAFTPDGRQLLACIGGTPGLLIAYDAQSLKELKRIAMAGSTQACTVPMPTR